MSLVSRWPVLLLFGLLEHAHELPAAAGAVDVARQRAAFALPGADRRLLAHGLAAAAAVRPAAPEVGRRVEQLGLRQVLEGPAVSQSLGDALRTMRPAAGASVTVTGRRSIVIPGKKTTKILDFSFGLRVT